MKQEIANTIANIFLNVDSSRVRHPSLHRRKEGWTEVWGVEDDESPISQPKKPMTQSKPTLVITQFDISHAEQLVLRIGNVPHVVRNSTYMVTEATGPLPYITDLSSSSSSSSPPSLVGRHHPHNTTLSTPPKKGCNHILNYLKQNNHIDLDRHLTTPEQQSQSILYENIIVDTLEPLLARALRDENSERIRARRAAGRTSSLSHFQYEAMRYRRSSVTSHYDDVSSGSETGCFLTTAMKEIYSAFNVVLASHSTLLGTETPTMVDALLYDHLAKACRHVDWLLLLNNECGNLLKFYKRLYDDYFSETRRTGREEWRMRNDEANRENAYYVAADHLSSVIDVVVPVTKQKPLAGTTFHRVRYGGDIWLSDDDDDVEFYGVLSGHYRRRRKEAASSDDDNTSMRSKLKKDDQHYDTLWMGFVLAGIAMAFVSTNRNIGASV